MSSALSPGLRMQFCEYIEEGLCGRAAVARLKLSAATVAHLQRKHDRGEQRRVCRLWSNAN